MHVTYLTRNVFLPESKFSKKLKDICIFQSCSSTSRGFDVSEKKVDLTTWSTETNLGEKKKQELVATSITGWNFGWSL